jgi:hypothetical protein
MIRALMADSNKEIMLVHGNYIEGICQEGKI